MMPQRAHEKCQIMCQNDINYYSDQYTVTLNEQTNGNIEIIQAIWAIGKGAVYLRSFFISLGSKNLIHMFLKSFH